MPTTRQIADITQVRCTKRLPPPVLRIHRWACDPSRHPQECPGAQAGKCPKECFFRAICAGRSAFWPFEGQRMPKSTPWSTLWATPSQVPENRSKCTCRPGPLHVLPFLAFLDFLGFFPPARTALCFLSVFPFFARDFRVR